MSQRTRARTTGAAARRTSQPPRDGDETESLAPTAATEPAAAPAPRRGKRAAAPETTPAQEPLALGPDALARALRAMASELERDPALAQRVAQAISEAPAVAPVSGERSQRAAAQGSADEPAPPSIGRTFHPTIVTGVAEALGPGVPDPFALRQRLGEEGLRDALASLRLGSLRAVLREYHLDPSGKLSKLNDAEKLRAHILQATARK